MSNHNLDHYKSKLSKLTTNQQQQRNLYLRKIAVGEIQGPVTGFPTIDKSYLKYMSEDDILTDIRSQNVYCELYNNNYSYPNQTALIFFGKKITYGTFFNKIDAVAKSLIANGVEKGDFISVMSVTIPETIYIFYACAKLGAVVDFMNPLLSKGRSERIRNCHSKLVIVLDKFYKNVINDIKTSGVKKCILLPTLNSSILGTFSRKPKINKANNEISWNAFIKEGKGSTLPSTIPYEKDMPLVAVSSSGSTGFPKAIILTHDSFENSVHAYPRCDVKISRNDLYYQIIPPWFSTGISTSVNLPLTYGGTLFIDPRFDRKVFIKNNLKLNPTGTIAPVSLFQGFLDEKLLSAKGNLSHYKVCFQGGEKIDLDDKIAIEKVFKKYHSDARLMNGYGQCECGAGIATQTQNTPANVSAGIPIPGVSIMIADENRNEVLAGTRGEILVNTPCSMKEYLNDKAATDAYFYYDKAGRKWNCTGDIGYIDSDGELTVVGRMNDFSMVGSRKIYNFDIEDIIRSLKFIQNCDVFTDNSGEITAHIILKDNSEHFDNESVIAEIQKTIFDHFNDLDFVPERFKFRSEFPASATGKRDVASMKAEKDGFITKDKHALLGLQKTS